VPTTIPILYFSERPALVNTNLALARALTEQREAAAVYHELFHEWPARCDAIVAAPAAEQRATNRVPAPA
jgi:hypothetical protein